MQKFDKDLNSLPNVKPNVFYERFNEIDARKSIEKEFLEIEKIKSNKNEKISGTEYVVEMIDISKTFNDGKVIANDEINLLIAKNEIHAIIGENGAGKSTLMSILFGIYAPDKGTIKINGQTINFKSAKDAAKHKIGMVHQHFKLVPTYSVLDNIVLGCEDTNSVGILNNSKAIKKLKSIIKQYSLGIQLSKKIDKLTVSEQQKVEILKLLYRDSEILIFDEPTAVLSPFEIISFLEILKILQKEGKTIIIITHKFDEVKDVANRATIIRHGRFISAFNVKEKTISEMAEAMVGKKIDEISNQSHVIGEKDVLVVKNLNISKVLSKNKHSSAPSINFSIREGEIFAIAGVDGNGQREIALAIAGLIKVPMSQIVFNQKDITNLSIDQRYKLGLSHVPEDRQKSGLILDMPCFINMVSNQIDDSKFSTFKFIKNKNIQNYSKKILEKFDVRGTAGGIVDARSLSGGNQQKLIVAREMTNKHKLIILVQPTRGLDLGAIEYIHGKILEEKQRGNAILLISYELSEVLALADTIAVINKGIFVDVSNIQKTSRQKIGELMLKK